MKPNLRFILNLLVILVADVIVLGVWVYKMDPDPSASLALLIIVPFVFVVNLVIAGIFIILKKRMFINLFLINSVLASVVVFYLFGKAIDYRTFKTLQCWEFKKNDTTFQIIRYKESRNFSMNLSTNIGSSQSFLDGTWKLNNGDYILATDSTRYIIHNGYLIGFRTPTDTIKLKEN